MTDKLERRMSFREAMESGVKAWSEEQRALAEVEETAEDFCGQLDGFAVALVWRHRTIREGSFSYRKNFEVRGSEGWRVLCWVDVPPGGRPFTLRVGDDLPPSMMGSTGRRECFDKADLESALCKLLSAPETGHLISSMLAPMPGAVAT